MIRHSKKTPQLVAMNRIFLALGITGMLVIAGCLYLENIHHNRAPKITEFRR